MNKKFNSKRLNAILRTHCLVSTYMYMVCLSAVFQKTLCNDHKNTVLKGEYLK